MSNSINRLPAMAMAALLSFATVASAAEGTPLVRWRSYAGVSWEGPEVFSGYHDSVRAGASERIPVPPGECAGCGPR